ncbi:sensor histidine kinase [Clostridium amazonitimonense]|uniref:sensor histidine kinase n=1 Tax=Clostridium amazonitimonense TaxID=1499689 RepID=UPI000509683C|nr:sensor histidine kinase [Clostridium amazonitimonense]
MKKIWFNFIILFFYIIEIIMGESIKEFHVILLLFFLCIDVFREKYFNNNISRTVEAISIFFIMLMDIKAVLLLGIFVIDVEEEGNKVFPLLSFGLGIGFLLYKRQYNYLPSYALYGLLCFIIGRERKKSSYINNLYKSTHDKERRYIYELESTKQKLMNSSREIVYLTEAKERNRIARTLHDNLGHKIAGILMQLQASRQVALKDQDKMLQLLDKSIEGLSSSLELIRDTVHNIKPKENVGIEYIKKLIEDFTYCNVEFKYKGDFNNVNSLEMEIITSTLKEALTNISKYSKASKVNIEIDANVNFIRIYIKDDGVGAENIKEGLGISGMKERLKNIGGNLSISSQDGFMIVGIIPRISNE